MAYYTHYVEITDERIGPLLGVLSLVVHFSSRFDQIHFKLFAMVDQGGGRHETAAYLPVFADASNAVLTRLRAAH